MSTADASYELWKQRGKASLFDVTVWGVMGVIITLCVIVAYYKVGKERP